MSGAADFRGISLLELSAPLDSSLAELTRLLRMRAGLPDPARRREIREGAGATLKDVADVVGVTQAAVSRWESGARVPRREHLEAYVMVLHHLLGIAG